MALKLQSLPRSVIRNLYKCAYKLVCLCIRMCVSNRKQASLPPSLPHLGVSYPSHYSVFLLSTCSYRLHSPELLVYISSQQKHSILIRWIRRHKRQRQNHPDTHGRLFRFSLADRLDITTAMKRCDSVPGCLGDFFPPPSSVHKLCCD